MNSISVAHVDRALLFATLSSPLALDVRLYQPNGSGEFTPRVSNLSHLTGFIDTIAPCMHSLEVAFLVVKTHRYSGSALLTCFTQCISQHLESLVVSHQDEAVVFFDTKPAFEPPEYLGRSCRPFLTGNPHQTLSQLTVLHAQGIYPMWTSNAYHRLVELRLIHGGYDFGDPNILISKDHLQGVLTASPTLRILEFSANIVPTLPENTNIIPIPLGHLKSINITRMAPGQLGMLLRWLAPGSEPLQLAILDDPCIEGSLLAQLKSNEVQSFFLRSNVTEVYAIQLSYLGLFELLDLCPHLKTLAWSFFNFSIPAPNYLFPTNTPTSLVRLETLLILGGSFKETTFPNLIGGLSTITSQLQRVLFWNCKYYTPLSYKRQPVRMDHLEHMLNLCLEVKVTDSDPTSGWEVFAQ